METKLTRGAAIAHISEALLGVISIAERNRLIAGWWVGAVDATAGLPASLLEEMERSEGPEHDIAEKRYDPLVALGLRERFRGVRNEYLSALLKDLIGAEAIIVGSPDYLIDCTCCGYRTLDRRGEYDICPVCFWEDDGNVDPAKLSAANHMTLGEGRENFLRVGACSERFLKNVNRDGHRMFLRVNDRR